MSQSSIDPGQIVAAALAATGAQSFADLGFMPIYERYVDALNREADLNAAGIAFHQTRLTDLLSNRLRLQDWFTRHPEILEEQIQAPIVVVGLPRTGTTMLHRTIASDSRLMAPLWFEVRYPVPLTATFPEHDARIDIAHAEVAAILEAAPELAAIHPFDAVAPDEEIMLLEQSFMSTVAESWAHLPEFGHWLYQQDQQYGYDDLKRLLQFLQWQKKQCGHPGGRWLLKTPHHLHYPQHLFQTFPDASVIQTHRHPRHVIPSYASMIHALIAPYSNRADKVAIAAHWADKWRKGLDTTASFREAGQGRYCDLWFEDTVAQPEREIAKVYDFIGSELTEEALTEMRQWRELNQRENRPEHHYTLEEFGFSDTGICEQFKNYISRYIES